VIDTNHQILTALVCCRLKINPNVKNIDDFKFEDFELEGYDPYPTIKMDMAV